MTRPPRPVLVSLPEAVSSRMALLMSGLSPSTPLQQQITLSERMGEWSCMQCIVQWSSCAGSAAQQHLQSGAGIFFQVASCSDT